MKSLFWLITLSLTAFLSFGQDLFLKESNNFSSINAGSPSIHSLTDGRMTVVTSTTNLQNNSGISVIQYTKCGEVIWSKHINHQRRMRLVESTVDLINNVLISGYFDDGNLREPFLISIAESGSINFFNKYQTNTSNLSSLTYSLSVNSNNEYYIYINYDITTPGTASRPSLLKLNSDGTIIWYKLHNFHSWQYGFMLATSDNGVLYTMSNSFIKVNAFGDVEWKKTINGRFNPMKGIETDSGYVFATLNNSSALPINFVMLDKEGAVKWNIINFNTFLVNDATIKINGNVLFTGQFDNGNQGTTLEINTNSGSLVEFKDLIIDQAFSRMSISSITEDNNGSLLYSGVNQLNTFPQLIIGKINDSIAIQSCPDSLIQANYTIDTTTTSDDATPLTITNTNVLLIPETYKDSTQNYSSNTLCSYTKNRGVIELGNDTTLCEGTNLTLGTNNSSFDAYLWSTGDTTKTINITQPGNYWLKVLAACDTLTDSIDIGYASNINFSIGNDTILCSGDSLILASDIVLTTYQWSNGEAKNSITVYQPGIYWLESFDSCSVFRDSIRIVEPQLPPLNLGNDTVICPGDSIQIGQNGFDFYQWSTNETIPFITVKSAGVYQLITGNSCDTIIDSIGVTLHPEIAVNFFFSDTIIFTNEEITFLNLSNPNGIPIWDMGNGDIIQKDSFNYVYRYPNVYKVNLSVASNEGCTFDTSKTITVLRSNYGIPNIFSPNGDGINELFEPFGRDITAVTYLIRNRWGTVVFESDDVPWDGQLKSGAKASEGTYFYTLKLHFIDGRSVSKSGNVFLTR
tara:strand:- start:315 stop:2720 length:2406 start_codon:yes stop_codon:yes gene_type:complete